MNHYSSEQWADYVRGSARQDEKLEMERHLELGCTQCAQAAGLWMRVQKLARKEIGYQPPESVVRLAKSYFDVYRNEGGPSLVPTVALLVFDSFQRSALAGVRSEGPLPRHCVYRSGSVLVDIWTGPADQAAAITLMGQVLDQSSAVQAVKDMVVKLRSKDADISATITNQFGEFHFLIGQTNKTALQLTLGDHEKIAVLIPLLLVGDAQAGQ
jgi:hypothetical protein